MVYTITPSPPVAMIADQVLYQSCQGGRMPDVQPGAPFWAMARDVPGLLSGGQAHLAPPGTPMPPVEPAWTANQLPGFGAGTSNCSH